MNLKLQKLAVDGLKSMRILRLQFPWIAARLSRRHSKEPAVGAALRNPSDENCIQAVSPSQSRFGAVKESKSW